MAFNKRTNERLHSFTIKIVILREQTKVQEWKISDKEALAVTTLKNDVAGVSDGKRATKFLLFEELAKGIEEGNLYRIKHFGWSNYGDIKVMLTRHQTVAYIAAAVEVPAHLEAEARDFMGLCETTYLLPTLTNYDVKLSK